MSKQMDERRQLILEELKRQCEEKQLYEFERYWEMWGVMWYPWFIEFPDNSQMEFTTNEVTLKDLNYFVEIGELEVVKVYEIHEMDEDFERVRFRLIKTEKNG